MSGDIEVPRPALRRAYRSQSTVRVTWLPDPPRDDAFEQFSAAVGVAAEHEWTATAESPRITPQAIAPGPDGPILVLDDCETFDAFESFVQAVANALERQGASGSLQPAPSVIIPLDDTHSPAVTAALSVTLNDKARKRDVGAPISESWDVDTTPTTAVLDHLETWMLDMKGELYVRSGRYQYQVAPAGARTAISAGLKTYPTNLIVTSFVDLDNYRRLTFSAGGHVTVQSRKGGIAQNEITADYARIFESLAPYLDLGVVRYFPTVSIGWIGTLSLPPLVPFESDRTAPWSLQFVRSLEADYTPDAYGLQLLTDAHIAKVTDLSRWQVDEIASGRYLVRARNLEPWFASQFPDTTLLDAARADFGNVILTQETYERIHRESVST